MANIRSKPGNRKRRDPLPEHFRSLDEAGEFWDTHDSADYEEHMRDVECEVDIHRRKLAEAPCARKVRAANRRHRLNQILHDALGLNRELAELWEVK